MRVGEFGTNSSDAIIRSNVARAVATSSARVAEAGLDGADVASDPAEQLLRRLHDDAVLAREVARAQHLERVVGERRRHVRTVRSAARARNQPRRMALLMVLAVLGLLAVLVARANAAPRRDAPPPGLDVDPSATEDDWNDDDDDDADGGTRASGRGRDSRNRGARPVRATATRPRSRALVARAPSVREVVDAAQRAAGLAEDGSRGWLRRARLSALVPFLSVRVGNTQSWRDVVDPTVNRAVAFDVRAGWRLDRLVFDSVELRSARRSKPATRAAHRGRARESRVLRLASAPRHRRCVTLAWQVRRSRSGRGRLDALTDGVVFSDARQAA